MEEEEKEENEEKAENEEAEKIEIESQGTIEQRVEQMEEDVNEVKSEIKKMSSDLGSVVSELKKSIIDVRAAVSEIENPFNLLRSISSEKDLKRLNSERKRLGIRSLALEKAEEKEEAEKPSEPSLPLSSEQEERPIQEERPVERKERPVERMVPLPTAKTGFGQLKWVWSLLDLGLTPEDIMRFSEYCEHIGYLQPNSSQYISSLAYAANKAKKKGLDKEQLMMSMYQAAMTSGAKVDGEDIKEIVSVAISGIKTRVRSE